MKFEDLSSLDVTPVPNEFFDEMLPEIDDLEELKVILYVLRRTLGSGKFVERISEDEFIEALNKGKK
jgi:hypothetical protein